MTKSELVEVTRELKSFVEYPGTGIEPLYGLGLPDFPKGKMVSKECIVSMLRWQCIMLNGNIDEQELENCLWLLKEKKVVMV